MVAFLMNIQIKPFLATQIFVVARVKSPKVTSPGHRFAAMERFMIGKGGCAAMVNSWIMTHTLNHLSSYNVYLAYPKTKDKRKESHQNWTIKCDQRGLRFQVYTCAVIKSVAMIKIHFCTVHVL